MARKVGLALAGFVVLTLVAFAQDGRFDASVSFAGTFPDSTTANGITHSGTNGAEIFGTFRFRFNRRSAFAFNYGRGKDSQIYLASSDFHILTNITEYSGAYVFTPFQTKNLETMVFGGIGGLVFDPQSEWIFYNDNTDNPFGINQTQVTIGASKQTEMAFLYGGGVDYRLSGIPIASRIPLSSHFAFRLQYRGLIFKNPDFGVTSISGSIPSLVTNKNGHMAEPAFGLVFKF